MSDTRLLSTSVIRMTPPGEISGYVRLISMKERRVLAEWPIPETPYRQYDHNPRGGLRGGRGISGDAERIVIATTDRLFVFDRSWRQIGDLSHPFLGEVHDILVEPDGVWVTSVASDMLVKLSWSGTLLRTWSWREDPELKHALGLTHAPPFDERIDYRDPHQYPDYYDFVHLNSVCATPEGLLLSFGFVLSDKSRRFQQALGAPGALLKRVGLDPKRVHTSNLFEMRFLTTFLSAATWAGVLVPQDGSPARVVIKTHPIRLPNHNLLQRGDALIYNDTNSGLLVQQALDGSWKKQIRVPGSPAFARGLTPLGGNRFAVGSQRPVSVHELDLDSMKSELICELATRKYESVYGLHVVPEGFDDPPARLWPQ